MASGGRRRARAIGCSLIGFNRDGSNGAIGANPIIVSEARHYESMDHKQSTQTIMVRREQQQETLALRGRRSYLGKYKRIYGRGAWVDVVANLSTYALSYGNHTARGSSIRHHPASQTVGLAAVRRSHSCTNSGNSVSPKREVREAVIASPSHIS
ncbi:hypothetical protein NA56DRAFT_700111 [Hyaloscypha hepaticicola]|uniref:Uncharacterized protein n=1 Tax=Hyaloscypha hepaticicola TaxID=2082293 RepID=A0A2J6QDX7_9HELO|nr:hypothetical protein NA56DRAFT_700111 [Hyaloscypha hepaticicola]